MIRIPLLIDNHNHLFTYSNLNQAKSLFYVHKKDDAIAVMKNLPENEISVLTGWFDSYYNFSNAELQNFPPIIICNNSLHRYLFNDKAAMLIEKRFIDFVKNNHNQLWVEKNIMKIISFISGLFPFSESSLNETIRKNLNLGVLSASDMFVNQTEIFDYLLRNEDRYSVEVWTDPELFPQLPEEHKRICKGVKLFTDGALGASTAAISSYKKNGNSFLTYNDNEFNSVFEKSLSLKTNIAVHCIGDIAIEQVINTIENFQNQIGSRQIRLEHAQFISLNQAKRAKKLGVILSMQPNFNMDSIVYADRLTNLYCRANNPFRMLIDEVGFIPGKDLIFGSDGMPTGVFGTLQESLFPPVPEQKLSLDEFVAAYCCNDFDNGYITVEIDQLKKKVLCDVVVEKKT